MKSREGLDARLNRSGSVKLDEGLGCSPPISCLVINEHTVQGVGFNSCSTCPPMDTNQ